MECSLTNRVCSSRRSWRTFPHHPRTDDPVFSQDDARSLGALIPLVDRPHFVDAGHYLQADAPDAILSHMDRFLAANP